MELKRSHRTTELSQRRKFIQLWLAGSSARGIAQQTGASATTVCRWIRRWKSEGHINLRHRKGRPTRNVTWDTFNNRSNVIRPLPLQPITNPWSFGCLSLLDQRLTFDLNKRKHVPNMLPGYPVLFFGIVLNKLSGVHNDS